MSDRLALPSRPVPPEPPPFPMLGVVAPLLLAAGLFLVLGTPTVLLIAVFSPVLAVAAVVDGRLQIRRRARRDARLHAEAVEEVGRAVEVRRSALVEQARERSPSPAVLAADPLAWAGRPPSGVLVLGSADLACAPIVAGTATTDRERALIEAGSVLPDAPLTLPSAATVAVVGPRPLADAFSRAVAVARLRGSGADEGASVLPRTAGAGADLVVEIGADGAARVVHASGPAEGCAARRFRPALVTEASHLATTAQGGATGLDALLGRPAAGGLAARFLLGPDGPLDLDLVADGPHAIVGGTTGSGKSALLTAWILALAAAHPPDRLVLLLVDCKGGAAFDPLARLPHVAGIVTDLDGQEAERAVASLAAEMRRRERALREAGAADAAAAGIARLVVVVDEYRALVEAAPALAALFGDVAARGRSLGVHLILCTQRPGGSIRDDVVANCAVRLCLRVHDAADSRAVVGTDAAARLGREPIGAVMVATERLVRARVAALGEGTVRAAVDRALARHPGATAAAPWLPPLPAVLPLESLPEPPSAAVRLGRVDLPDEQRQPVLAWDAARHPRLLVTGDPGTGRSTALAVVARGLGRAPIAPDPAQLWDRIAEAAAPLLVDDLDHLLDRLEEATRPTLIERLAQRLRDPAAAPTVVTVRGPSAWAGLPLRGLVGLFDEVLQLALGLDDHLAMGGTRAGWSADRRPGRARFAGASAQVAATAPVAPEPAPEAGPAPEAALLVVTDRPGERSAQLAGAGRLVLRPDAPADRWHADGVAVVGGATSWHAHWQRLGAARERIPVVADRVPAADLRTLLGVTAVLPPVTHPDDAVLLLPERDPVRVRLPR